ncbi:MAG: WbqC family protein [Candidatus Cryptobacteroides sp.]
MLISTAYFPPIEYFANFAKYSVVYIEACENYLKQTYRNRCRILTANGAEDLRVPILHDGHRNIREIRIDYSKDWIRQSEYAIDSAYYNSAFFEYYRDELFSILDFGIDTLWDLNLVLIKFFSRKLGMGTEFRPTLAYKIPQGEPLDFRYSLSPKRPSAYLGQPYYQVFREKFGFVPNLSIMDLLFNEGPESICYL